MSYQGPPSWRVPPQGGYREAAPQPQPAPQWQPVPPPQPHAVPWYPPPVPKGCVGCRVCGLVGPPRVVRHGASGPDSVVAVLLLLLCFWPGIAYLLLAGSSGSEFAYCQRCNALQGRWNEVPWLKVSALAAAALLSLWGFVALVGALR